MRVSRRDPRLGNTTQKAIATLASKQAERKGGVAKLGFKCSLSAPFFSFSFIVAFSRLRDRGKRRNPVREDVEKKREGTRERSGRAPFSPARSFR